MLYVGQRQPHRTCFWVWHCNEIAPDTFCRPPPWDPQHGERFATHARSYAYLRWLY